MNTKAILICLSISFFAAKVSAQEKYLSDKSQTEQLSKKVVALFLENKITEATEALTPFWPIPQNEIEAFDEKTIKYMNLYIKNYEAPVGSLKLKDETIADIAVRETYIIRFKVTAIRLKFTYYKSEKGWIVNSFKWDDSFAEEFK